MLFISEQANKLSGWQANKRDEQDWREKRETRSGLKD
jgi:hypothetical protein